MTGAARSLRGQSQRYEAESLAALEAHLLALVASEAKWQEWAEHQEWCRPCSEAHPRECSDGALLWAKCHPEAEGAARIIDERGTPPEDTTPHG